MSKYKVFDRFVIEIAEVIAGYKNNPDDIPEKFEDATTTLYRVKGFNSLVFDKYGLDKLKKIDANFKINDIDDMLAEYDIRKDGYNKGLQDAWKLAFKIWSTTCEERNEIFGLSNNDNGLLTILTKFTPQEAIARMEAYEKKQEEIKVGDVVEFADETKAVVMDIAIDSVLYIFNENGCVESAHPEGVKKTGKHIDIGSLLEQIGGE